MDYVLRERLPLELVEIIAKMVHRMYLRDVHEELIHHVIWILADGQRSFWVCKCTNYYSVLSDGEIWKRLNHKLKHQ